MPGHAAERPPGAVRTFAVAVASGLLVIGLALEVAVARMNAEPVDNPGNIPAHTPASCTPTTQHEHAGTACRGACLPNAGAREESVREAGPASPSRGRWPQVTSTISRFEAVPAPCGQRCAGERLATEDLQGLVTEDLRSTAGAARLARSSTTAACTEWW